MDKEQLDEFYHELRMLCVSEDVFQKEAIAGITSHLTQPRGDYTGLLRFLSYYGEKYILPSVVNLLYSAGHLVKFGRIVEFGAGFGWLGRGISDAYDRMPVMFVDKRQWVLVDVVADIETESGAKRVLDELEEGDLIVASELIHCLDNPGKVMEPFAKWPILIAEYDPVRADYRWSYGAQIKKFNCKPVADIKGIFPKTKVLSRCTDTHGIWLILPLQEETAHDLP